MTSFACILAFLLLALVPSSGASAQSNGAALRIVYLDRDGDILYESAIGEDGVTRAGLNSPFVGAELAMKDVRAVARAAGVTFALERRTLTAEDDAVASAVKAANEGAIAIIVDLPEVDFVAVAKALASTKIVLFNIRHTADSLRRDLCATNVFHIIPSESALSDALAQFVVKKNWRRILTLVGPLLEDQRLASTFAASAKKFGGRIVESKSFIFGNDPRQREQINVALLTADAEYDVVFIADSSRDFGRYVPYRLAHPRPVIGTEGLEASAWSPLSEREGAPQVNHRFERDAHHGMSDLDWSAWMAVHAVADAASRHAARSPSDMVKALADDALSLDLSKGTPGSFRHWDKQLRQPIMLHSADAVIEYAPLEGFLHEHTTLDTLGLAENEVPCGLTAK
jgi:ABC transporter substrate binding protein (PQQ-dependent alcohol dehydrogenase system)